MRRGAARRLVACFVAANQRYFFARVLFVCLANAVANDDKLEFLSDMIPKKVTVAQAKKMRAKPKASSSAAAATTATTATTASTTANNDDDVDDGIDNNNNNDSNTNNKNNDDDNNNSTNNANAMQAVSSPASGEPPAKKSKQLTLDTMMRP